MAQGTQIAQAYVQIIPTTENIAENIKKSLSGVENIGTEAGSSIMSGFKKAILSAGIGAFIGKTIVDAFKLGGDFEQLWGGAQQIFKGMDTSQILKDASDAYKTLGMSANEYLRIINDVGAAFKSTMGSTEGYETAKKGLQAISDYASGTGKDISVLAEKFTMITRSTSSYQSIADQFSGILPATSKSFLEQAQAAGDLADSYTSLTQVPLAEYQRAVASALERGVAALGLTGNTAKEASTTLLGAIASMVAAWENFKTSLTQDDLSTTDAFNGLIESFGNVIMAILPMATDFAFKLVETIANGLPELIPRIVNIFGEAFQQVIHKIPDIWSNLTPQGKITAVVMAVATIGRALSGLVPIIGAVTKAVIALDLASLPLAGEVAIIAGIAAALGVATYAALDFWGSTESGQQFIENLARLSMEIDEAGGMLNWLKDIGSQAWNEITESLRKAFPVQEEWNNMMSNFSNAWNNAKSTVSEALSSISSAVSNAFGKITDTISSWGGEFLDKIQETFKNIGQRIVDAVQSIPARLKQIGQNMAQGLVDGFVSKFEAINTKVVNTIEKLVDAIKNALDIHSPSRVLRDEVGVMMARGLQIGWSKEMAKVNAGIDADIQKEYSFGQNAIINSVSKQPNTTNLNSTGLAGEIVKAMQNVTVNNTVTLEGDAGKLFTAMQNQNRVFRNSTGRSAFA